VSREETPEPWALASSKSPKEHLPFNRCAIPAPILPGKVVAFKLLTADFRDPNCIGNITQKNQQVRLRLGHNARRAGRRK